MTDLFCANCMGGNGPFTFIWGELICRGCFQEIKETSNNFIEMKEKKK